MKTKFCAALVTFIAAGCLPKTGKPELARGNQSGLTSVKIGTPKSTSFSYNSVTMNFTPVDKDGKRQPDKMESDLRVNLSESREEVTSTIKIPSAMYKVILNFEQDSTIVASTTFCKSEEHTIENNKIQEIFGATFALKLFVCKKDGTEELSTETKETEVSVTPVIVEHERKKVEKSDLVVGTTYDVLFAAENAYYYERIGDGACKPGAGVILKMKYLGVDDSSNIELELIDKKDGCPAKGIITEDRVRFFEVSEPVK